MAEVVYRSTQYLDDSDLRAMATYLKELPQHTVRSGGAAGRSPRCARRSSGAG